MDVKKSYSNPQLVRLEEDTYIVAAELKEYVVNSFQINIENGKILEIDNGMLENLH